MTTVLCKPLSWSICEAHSGLFRPTENETTNLFFELRKQGL